MDSGGQFANTNARGKILTDALKRALARSGDGDMYAGANKVVQVAVDAALAGEQWAIKEIWDRLEGKPAQAIEHQGADGNPFRVEHIVRTIVDARNSNAKSVPTIVDARPVSGSVGGAGVRQVTLLRRTGD
jgi:hypothetical protein